MGGSSMRRLGGLAACLAMLAGIGGVSGPAQGDQIAPGQIIGQGATGARVAEVETAIRQFQSGQLDQALATLQAAAQARPELPPARLMLARMLLATRQPARGRAELERVALEHPQHPGIYALFGDLALSDGRLTDAQVHFEKATALIEGGSALPEDQKAELELQLLAGRAGLAERRGDWAAALDMVAKLVAREPANPALRGRLGRLQFELGRTDQALETLRLAARLDATLEPGETAMGGLHAGRQEPELAIKWFREGVRLAPTSLPAHVGLAIYLIEQERPEEARPVIEAAAKIEPAGTSVRMLRALLAHRTGQAQAAVAPLEAVLQAQPTDIAAGNLLALALADQPEPAGHLRAVEQAQSLVKQQPLRTDLLPTLGWAYLRAGRTDDALRVFEAATRNGQARPETAYFLACALAEKGDKAEAARLIRSAMGAPVGQFWRREEARRMLERLEAGASASPAAGR